MRQAGPGQRRILLRASKRLTATYLNKPYPLDREEVSNPSPFFEAVCQAFQLAEEARQGPVDRFYAIGGHTVRLRFAGPALLPFITPALKHLATKPFSTPSLTVCLWDSASTGTTMPPPPWSTDDYIIRGEVRGYNDGRILAALNIDAGVLSILDTRLDLAVLWTRDARQIPYYETAAPLRAILHWWMRKYGCQLVHGGAVGTSEGCALVAGKGGCGKSTTALACLGSGLFYLGDDYVLLSEEPAPFVYSLYNSAKVAARDVGRFPYLLSAVSNSDKLETEKAVIFLHSHYPEKLATGLPLRAILLPRVTGLPETRLKKASPGASLRALAPSTIFQLPGASKKDFQSITALVRQVPSYILELGCDICRIPDAIIGLLSGRGHER